MTKRNTLMAINAVFSQLADYPQHGFDTVRDILYRMNLESEKAHRRRADRSFGISAVQAAKLFTVQQLAKGIDSPGKWTIDDINSVRLEVLKAQAYAKQHRAEILAAFDRAGVSVSDALAWDYAALMSGAA